MPRATADVITAVHLDLKSCAGGFVKLRRLTYGQKLHRQSMAMKMAMSQSKGQDVQAQIDMGNEAVTIFEYASCIVEHNLEDDNGKLLDFKKEVDVRRLDPRIGEEIEIAIGKLNNFEEDDASDPSGN